MAIELHASCEICVEFSPSRPKKQLIMYISTRLPGQAAETFLYSFAMLPGGTSRLLQPSAQVQLQFRAPASPWAQNNPTPATILTSCLHLASNQSSGGKMYHQYRKRRGVRIICDPKWRKAEHESLSKSACLAKQFFLFPLQNLPLSLNHFCSFSFHKFSLIFQFSSLSLANSILSPSTNPPIWNKSFVQQLCWLLFCGLLHQVSNRYLQSSQGILHHFAQSADMHEAVNHNRCPERNGRFRALDLNIYRP